jgi:hypothetical protein
VEFAQRTPKQTTGLPKTEGSVHSAISGHPTGQSDQTRSDIRPVSRPRPAIYAYLSGQLTG